MPDNEICAPVSKRTPWNKGKIIGARPPLRPKHVWSIRTRLLLEGRIRDLALFNLAIDSKLRGCDVVAVKVEDVAPNGYTMDRATVRQKKTGPPVKFELTDQTRQAVDGYLKAASKKPGEFLFTGRGDSGQCMTTRQYARLLSEWIASIGLDSKLFGTHSLRRTKATLIYGRTGNLRAVQLLLGHTKIESTVRYLGIEVDDVLSPRMVRVIEGLAGDWRRLDERIEGLSSEIEAVARQDAACERLMSVPGIGPIISSAMVAAIGTGDVFSKGRDFAAWLGLVPRQISTGDRTILGKISKRGNRYLRVLFVQAAWVVLIKPKSWERHGLKPWIEAAKKRLHRNVLAIALANKLAASPGAFWLVVEPSRLGRSMRPLPNRPDPHSTPPTTADRAI